MFWEEKRDVLSMFLKYYDILIPQLPGYACNKQGDFSEKTRNKQIEEVCKWCQQNYADNFVVMGYSLGCHFAILLAAKAGEHCKHLFLVNPFLTDKTAAKYIVSGYVGYTLGNIITTLIYRMKLDNAEAIKKVKCGIDIYYSCKDEIVDPKDAEELYKIAKAENHDREVVLLPNYYPNEECEKDILYIPTTYDFLPIDEIQKLKKFGFCFDLRHEELNIGFYSLGARLMIIYHNKLKRLFQKTNSQNTGNIKKKYPHHLKKRVL